MIRISSFFLVAIGLTAFLGYAGVFGWLSQVVAPTDHQEGNEGQTVIMHIHPSIEVLIDGQPVTIPANIGIDSKLWKDRTLARHGMPMRNSRETPYMSPLHTHDTTGTIHIESTTTREYTLGEFFDVWGVPFNDACVLDKCGKIGSVVMHVNGILSDALRGHVLKERERIRIEFRTG